MKDSKKILSRNSKGKLMIIFRLSFLLVGKGISSEELFQVINSNQPMKTAMEILEFEGNFLVSQKEETEKQVKEDKEKKDLLLSDFVPSNFEKPLETSVALLQKYKDIKTKKEIKHFLKRKRKDYCIDSTAIKEIVNTKKEDENNNGVYINGHGNGSSKNNKIFEVESNKKAINPINPFSHGNSIFSKDFKEQQKEKKEMIKNNLPLHEA